MPDLRERLLELADAAARDGVTPGPAHAIRRGRQRRRIIGGVASLLVVVVAVGVAGGTGRLPDRTVTRPAAPATPPSTTLPPLVVRAGPPSSAIESQLWEDIKTSLGGCGVRSAAGPRLIARGTAYGHRWILGGRPHGPEVRGCAGPSARPTPAAARIQALDRAGRVVASCRTGPLPKGT